MKYHDLVYGQFEITEPVILELINSPWLQRLKEINQGGYSPLFFKPDAKLIKSEHNRFNHSLGVYLLLKKYGASLEEQIAGLIHDVSHSVFSHCIDYTVAEGNGKEQNHQDNLFDSFLKKTDVPSIIKKYGLNLEYILDDKNFPLKEKVLPDLCADRIDYSLRDGIIFEEISDSEAGQLLDNLTVENNNWIFKNLSSAKKYAELFFTINMKHYACLSIGIMFLVMGDFLKYALQKGYISHNELYTTDNEVLKKIKQFLNQDARLNLLWQRLNDKNSISQNQTNYDAEIFCKSRIVDPLFKDGAMIKRLSEAQPDWGEIVKQELKPKQYFLKYNY